MPTPLLTVRLRRNADVVRARQHARHIAGLLGFGPEEQAGIAAAVFEVARHAHARSERAALHFQIAARALQVFATEPPSAADAAAGRPAALPAPGGRGVRRLLSLLAAAPAAGAGLRLDRPLPRELALAPEDLAWVVQEVARRAAQNLYEEARLQNQETLYLLHELNACREQLTRLTREPGGPQAA